MGHVIRDQAHQRDGVAVVRPASERVDLQVAGKFRMALLQLSEGNNVTQPLPEPGVDPAVSLTVPEDPPLSFTDLIRGEVNAPHPDDQVILKGDGFPTYNFAHIVDDIEMGVTHVMRGQEFISSMPKIWMTPLKSPLKAPMPRAVPSRSGPLWNLSKQVSVK